MRLHDTISIGASTWAVKIEQVADLGGVVSVRAPAAEVGQMLITATSLERPIPVVATWDSTGLVVSGDLSRFDLVERGRFTLATAVLLNPRIGLAGR